MTYLAYNKLPYLKGKQKGKILRTYDFTYSVCQISPRNTRHHGIAMVGQIFKVQNVVLYYQNTKQWICLRNHYMTNTMTTCEYNVSVVLDFTSVLVKVLKYAAYSIKNYVN